MPSAASYPASQNLFRNRGHWDENGIFLPKPDPAPGCWCPKDLPLNPTLCQRCQEINIRHLIFCEYLPDSIIFGDLDDVRKRTSCDLCSVIALGVKQVWRGGDWEDHSNIGQKTVNFTGLEVSRQSVEGYALSFYTNWQLVEFDVVYKGKDVSAQPVERTFEFSPKVKISLLKSMLKYCEKNHTECGSDIEHFTESMRVIDLKDMCVTLAGRDCRYCALSYVWGKNPGTWLNLLKDNVGSLGNKNALINAPLPKTVRDAMQLCLELGERYLWVDSLCIIQDDPVFQKQQIEIMDTIYAAAHFTIIVGAGDNANSGIPGLNDWTRNMQRQTIRIQDIEISNCLPKIRDNVDRSVWNTRGWTYQERMFANRSFLLSEAQAYFSCKEGVQYERKDHLIGDHMRLERFDYRSQYRSQRQNLMGNYKRDVVEYTLRSLTSQADILRAFQGVMNDMLRKFHQTFHYGLPNVDFVDALLWQPAKEARTRTADGSIFPSWSWSSCFGPVKYSFTAERATSLTNLRAFWLDGEEPNLFNVEFFFNNAGLEILSIVDKHSAPSASHPPSAEALGLTLKQEGRILFRTSHAFFNLHNKVPFTTSDSWWTDYTMEVNFSTTTIASIYHLSNPSFSGEPLGFIEFDKVWAELNLTEGKKWEFVALSLSATNIQDDTYGRNFTMRRGFGWPLVYSRYVRELVVNVMLVERTGERDGEEEVCRRLGVGKMYLDCWEDADTIDRWIVLE